MGILNVTPDSFSDGGRFFSLPGAVEHAARMVAEGAAIIDIGGESTRPGAAQVSPAQELDRVIPVVEALRDARLDAVISVDTSKPEVMRAAIDAGAGMINDVYALRAPGAVEAMAAATQIPVCLMHMQGEPRTMQQQPRYANVVTEVLDFLQERIDVCTQGGIARERVLVDPGFGFGKNLEHNYSLLRHLHRLAALQAPLLVGISRKSMIGAILGVEVDERLYGSVAAAVIAAWQGAAILRVHDVRATVEALKICHATQNAL